MRQFFIIYAFVLILGVTVFGFRGCKSSRTPLEVFPDMDRQAKFHEQDATRFFDDGRTDRPAVPGTVPFVTDEQEEYVHLSPDNRFREDSYLASGKQATGEFGSGFPIEVTYENMLRGQQLFNINCSICHGQTGDGQGVIANPRYGFATIISLQQPRLIEMPEGEIFNTITHGKNTMGAYGSKIRVEDRWKVILYLRALQRSATATVEDVPPENRGELGI